jgi:hypothetical protein
MVTSVTAPAIPSRRLKPSRFRYISEVVLVSGTVVAAIAASGPIWSVRLGVAAAIVTALVACTLAWRELYAARHTHAQAMLQATREHGAALRDERSQNAAVVDALSVRIADASRVIEKQRITLALHRQQISALKGDRVYLNGEIEYRTEVIFALRETVREREAELIMLRGEPDAEVHHMPRRVLVAEPALGWRPMEADDTLSGALGSDVLESDGLGPKVIDLKAIEMAMPNYEADRQPA